MLVALLNQFTTTVVVTRDKSQQKNSSKAHHNLKMDSWIVIGIVISRHKEGFSPIQNQDNSILFI